jgi:molybdate transport system substrate-binding protein
MRRQVLAAALLLLTAGVAAREPAPVVVAAASLQEALGEAAAAWAARGHARPVLAFGASSALARQIQAGAPADLFASADQAWMDVLASKGLLAAGSRADLTGNRLVVIAARGDRTRLTLPTLGRVLAAGPLAMADPTAVPAGRYGRAALVRLGAWDAVRPRVVRAENVRAALALVERGAAPYGIVYATDARASRRVRVAGVFPRWSHPPIRYPVARLKDGGGEGFRRFLLSREGQAILARHGFTRS